MIEIGACKVKGKLSSMPSNDYNVTCAYERYFCPDVPWEFVSEINGH